MNKHNLRAWAMFPAILLTGLLATPIGAPAEVQDSEQVSKLLSDTRTMAFQLKEDAAAMEAFTRMNVSWQSHAAAINQIRDHVNALSRQVAKLKEARGGAAPWQQTAIDRINPFLDELGGYTAAVIEHINSDPKHTLADYKDYLEANADYSSDLAAMIGDFVDYGRTKQRLERLSTKLEVGAAGKKP
ncbi:MAG TPA: hypothetical protein VN519_16780 [Bryobacteraceae bacterium]|nr:hypothetical protein [Bryobacteraceae bacterium]